MRLNRIEVYLVVALLAFNSLWIDWSTLTRRYVLFWISPAPRLPQGINLPIAAPSLGNWQVETAFPGMQFVAPIYATEVPGNPPRVYVVERKGIIWSFETASPKRTKRMVLDLSDKVSTLTSVGEGGMLGLACHPQFNNAVSPGFVSFFVFYTSSENGIYHDRLSRFRLDPETGIADRQSEQMLIDQIDEDKWHNAGCLQFGPDGFLYVSVGDGGGANDILRNSQKIDTDLFSGLLRIDVDCIGGTTSHPPPRQPAHGTTSHYYIPNDNPFVGRPNALEEFWAIGLRNTFRFSFDALTNEIWGGDVGQESREEVNLIRAGGNYQWSFFEGTKPFTVSYLEGSTPEPLTGTSTPPLFEYPHTGGNLSVTGGYVYRGRRYPHLYGKYIYADYVSGRISAFTRDDLVEGRKLFVQRSCAVCHTPDPATKSLGPDLAKVDPTLTRAQLLETIKEPSKTIKEGYENWALVTDSGEMWTGPLVSSDDKEVRLLAFESGKIQTIQLPRRQIESLVKQKTSAMPVDLLKDLPPEKVQDLLAYVEALRDPAFSDSATMPVSVEHGRGSEVELARAPPRAICSFGQDLDNELFLCSLKGEVYRLVQTRDPESTTVPERLSQTGLFADTATLTPAPVLMPYEVKQPHWADGALSRRWISVPQGRQIRSDHDGSWLFPPGTVFVQHFDIPVENGPSGKVRRLETRVLVRDASERAVWGAAYKWNAEETDALLVSKPQSERIAIDARHRSGELQTLVLSRGRRLPGLPQRSSWLRPGSELPATVPGARWAERFSRSPRLARAKLSRPVCVSPC